jgi:phosphonate transport system substrate-binding protein
VIRVRSPEPRRAENNLNVVAPARQGSNLQSAPMKKTFPKVILAVAVGLSLASVGSGLRASAASKKPVTPKAKTKKAAVTVGTAAPSTAAPTTAAPKPNAPTLRIGTIPDQDPAKITRQFGAVADYLKTKTGLDVKFVPVTDYNAAVTAFRVGDLDLVWFGGLTGVQAQKQVPQAIYVAQRDIDARFKSVFIANSSARIPPINNVGNLAFIKGLSLTFGSEVSTSGRTMPQFFLDEAGLDLSDFKGQPGFSGSHDKTIRLVESGAFEVGALNKAVWDSNVAAKTVDLEKVRVIYETPSYYDYHWLARPDTDERFGSGTAKKLKDAFLSLSKETPEGTNLLSLFGAGSFIETKQSNYGQIEKVGKRLGLLN